VLANNGVALLPNAAGTSIDFDSKENGATSHQPQLEVALGAITSVTAGAGLTGGGAAGPVTLAVANAGIQSNMIADGAVSSSKIAPGSVGSTQLAAGAVSSVNIADGSVVKSLNTLKDDVTLAAGSNITIAPSGNNTLTISATVPPTPDITARVFNSTPIIGIPVNTETILTFDSERWDTADLHDPGGSALRAPVDGTYMIFANVAWSFNTQGRSVSVGLILNGTSRIALVHGPPNIDDGNATVLSVATIWRLQQGDTVRVFVGQNSGGGATKDILANEDPTSNLTPEFGMALIARM
jgi:hypothetical protein